MNVTKSALLVIDMENGFLNAESVHCIRNAKETLPACQKAVELARKKEIPVFFIKRQYREDGSDVELTRYQSWMQGGKSMTPGSCGQNSDEFPEELCPSKTDYVIVKPRWSAFFHTELDLILRRLHIRTVILAGTTTPNCIRSTCYDANSLEYNVVVLEDCCSSQTEEIQRVNIADMQRMGAVIMNTAQFEDYNAETIVDMSDVIFAEIAGKEKEITE